MTLLDSLIIIFYLIIMLAIGAWYFNKNKSAADYYVSGRSMKAWHVGLSVVATDVGGGFSIGLGGLGFAIGLSGSWMLLTGLIGAWLSAVLIIPIVHSLGRKNNWLSFPDLLSHFFSRPVFLVASVFSLIGYLGFTSSQMLAGAKLASAAFINLSTNELLLIMGAVAVLYTTIGGLKAVIFTDTIQWIILISGLLFIGVPIGFVKLGGLSAIRTALPPGFLSFTNISWNQAVNWIITIVPIWFIGMTLYQRIYASKTSKEAKKAWFIAGLFEYPIMSFLGVILGLFGRVAADQNYFAEFGYQSSLGMDPELGLPLFLRSFMPTGLLGLMLAAYFSAIMSTADSCLMASSGNLTHDLLNWSGKPNKMKYTRWLTFLLGAIALVLAWKMENVLDLMLKSYAFMVSGLFLPVIVALFFRRKDSIGVLLGMMTGGTITLVLPYVFPTLPFGLDSIVFGLIASFLMFFLVLSLRKSR
ncbi:MAG: sodium:solute symporter family protein [Bacteroidota bacterium]|nr:sodium:solute symporter family protein [Bacteroidota bacterium]